MVVNDLPGMADGKASVLCGDVPGSGQGRCDTGSAQPWGGTGGEGFPSVTSPTRRAATDP